MKRLIMHWTGGSYTAGFYEKQFYHYLVDGNAVVHRGIYRPEDNLDVSDGKYAAHCGGGNTGSIGVAMCAMAGFRSPREVGEYPIRPNQLERFLALCAELCQKYNLDITPQTVLTHYEFGLNHRNTASYGKIDISCLPPYPYVSSAATGDFLRQKIKWYRKRLG